jgi:hypothetical protein
LAAPSAGTLPFDGELPEIEALQERGNPLGRIGRLHFLMTSSPASAGLFFSRRGLKLTGLLKKRLRYA